MEKYFKINKISDVGDDKWTLLSQEIKKAHLLSIQLILSMV